MRNLFVICGNKDSPITDLINSNLPSSPLLQNCNRALIFLSPPLASLVEMVDFFAQLQPRQSEAPPWEDGQSVMTMLIHYDDTIARVGAGLMSKVMTFTSCGGVIVWELLYESVL